MKQGSSPEALPHSNPLFAVIDMRGGELLCVVEAKDSAEAAQRAVSIASMFEWKVDMSELRVAVVDECPLDVPTFLEAYFAQSGLFTSVPPGTTLQ